MTLVSFSYSMSTDRRYAIGYRWAVILDYSEQRWHRIEKMVWGFPFE